MSVEEPAPEPLARGRLGRALLLGWMLAVLAAFAITARLPGPPLARGWQLLRGVLGH